MWRHGEGKKIITSDADGFRSKRKCLEDKRAALDAPVHHYIDPVANRIDDFSQLIKCGARAIQLPAAVIRHNDSGAANFDGERR